MPAMAQITREDVGVDGSASRLIDPLEGTYEQSVSNGNDQTDMAITIYNSNLALVKDQRSINLLSGEQRLTFADVAQLIKPETVLLRSISNPGSIRILEQNYEFDLLSPQKLLEKYVGKDVELINFDTTKSTHRVTARLLSINNGPVYKVGEKIYLGYPGNVVLPEVPENLIAKPSLVWLLDNQSMNQKVEVSYLTGGISWKADYVLNIDEEESVFDIDAWVTLNNQSGTAYKNAILKLVAGDINQVRPQMQVQAMRGLAMAEAASDMRQESFGEYHLYTLPRRSTIKENQSKQVNLFNHSGIRFAKRYELNAQNYYNRRMPQKSKTPITALIEFENESENQLGIPLPMGIMRIYQRDNSGAVQFSGEDRIEHTPKDETVTLRMGNSFDLTAERVQTDYRKISNRVHESTLEITLKNHKEEDVTIDVLEGVGGDWTILSSNHSYTKKDAFTVHFPVKMKADSETKLEYTIRITY
jgi:hypothetical protein